MNPNLSICQKCKQRPATYGDGITWSKCSKCYMEDERPDVLTPSEGRPHQRIEGLTSIILPIYMKDYSLFHMTGNCIGNVREYTDPAVTPYELVVVDNGSPIKPPSNDSYYAEKVVVNQTNTGYTAACNKGIRVSEGEYVVLLCNDVLVFMSWLQEMKAVIDSGEADLVMAHPMYSNSEPFARASESFAVLRGTKQFDPIPGGRDFSCVMFKKSLYDEIGEFDELFFNYCSDSDYLKRMEIAGKKFKMLDNVATSHISDATGFRMEETPEIMNEDKKKYEEKWSNYEKEMEGTLPVKEELGVVEGLGNKFIRTPETGDKIYLVEGGTVRWIKSAEKFQELGGEFGKEETITKEEFEKYTRGEPLA